MLKKYLLFFWVLVTFHSLEAKPSDPLDFLSFLDLDEVHEEITRLRRDPSSPTGPSIRWGTRFPFWMHLVDLFSERNINISLIGWQNVYDSVGTLVAVNSIELAFPVRKNTDDSEFLDLGDYDDLHSRQSQHKVHKSFAMFEGLNNQTVSLDVIIELKDKHTDPPVLFHWTPTTTYFRPDGLVSLNKTQKATKEEVQHFVQTIRSKGNSSLEPLVLVYDEDGKLKTDKVKLVDFSLVGYVVDSWQASDDILLKSSRIMTEVAVNFKKEERAEHLGRRFNEDYPNYDWRVLVNPRKFLLDNDVWIKVSTDGFEFYEGDKDTYLVYGIKI